MSTETDTAWFRMQPVHAMEVTGARLAYRKIGSGPPLLMIHGWPFSSFSYRKLVRRLESDFTCYLPDTPGLGETVWRDGTKLASAALAETFKGFVDGLGLPAYSVLGHDTGATIARQLALLDQARARKLVLLNTEMPGHRPPWITLYQKLLALPGSAAIFKLLLTFGGFRRTTLAYGNCFSDTRLLDDDFFECFVRPLIELPGRMDGAIRYLRGIDWIFVDSLATRHADIHAQTMLIWGAEDGTFPVARARAMAAQFASPAAFREISGARLLVHEEKPDEVASAARAFLAA